MTGFGDSKLKNSVELADLVFYEQLKFQSQLS